MTRTRLLKAARRASDGKDEAVVAHARNVTFAWPAKRLVRGAQSSLFQLGRVA